jgi:hypothetical protein
MSAERIIQTNFFSLINNKLLKTNPEFSYLIFSSQNGITSNPIAKKMAKLNGLVIGVCDVFVSIPNSKYHGLYIEFKAKTGILSQQQQMFIKLVKEKGYDAVVMRDSEIAFNYLIKYLGE